MLVGRPDVYKTRVDLGAKGLPAGNQEGYALLDKGGITKSEFTQRVDYQRAVQGELGRTLEAIDGVQAASVSLTIPRDNVFVGSDAETPTAAVLIKTAPGTKLPNEAVQAIVHIVASSVADLKADDVTVADSAGNVLAAPGQAGDLANSTQMEHKSAVEASIAKSVTDLIAKSIGPDHAAVTVQADLEMNTKESTSTQYAPPTTIPGTPIGTPLPQTEKTSTETFTGAASPATGILGPDGTPQDATAPGTDYTKTETERENVVDKTDTLTKTGAGAITRLSVAVLLDSKKVAAGDLAQMRTTIAAAAGIDTTTRTDVLQVTRLPFDKTAAKAADAQLKAATSQKSAQGMMDLVRHVLTLAIIALVLFLAWRAIKKSEANRVPIRVPLDLRELEAANVGGRGQIDGMPEMARLADPNYSNFEALPPGVETEISELIERQPDDVAQTLRSWLADRRG